MCGRYTILHSKELLRRFKVKKKPKEPLRDNYNVAPQQTLPVITNHGQGNEIELMRWGLIPVWAKDESMSYKMINARAETILEKPTWKRPFKTQRCLIPASGFYEWQKDGKSKVPYYIHLKQDEIFSFAGLYDIWHDAQKKEVRTYSIITTKPNSLMKDIHDRMPVILSKKDEDLWVHPEGEDSVGLLEDLLRPYDAKKMEAYIVDKAVNTPKNNFRELINKV